MSEITQKELEAAGYGFVREAAGWWVFILPDGIAHDGGYFALERAQQAAREHYAPRKALAESQARNAALEQLVREAYDGHYGWLSDGDSWYWGKRANELGIRPFEDVDWRERAAKLLGDA